MSVAMDYEPAGELKIGQVGIANLKIRTLDVAKLSDEMRSRVQRAPNLFSRAAVVLDFGGMTHAPDAATARGLVDALRAAGVLPVALAYGTTEIESLSQQLGLPLLSKFRAQYERAGDESHDAPAPAAQPAPRAAEPARSAPAPAAVMPAAAPAVSGQPGLVQVSPIRSGQQVYADNRDLTVLSTVGAGAEVIADGSIHIYGALRGRALAGAQGFEQARIFCREFRAELVAIAGHYKVLEDVPENLQGRAVQVWLDGGQLRLEALDA